MRHKIIQIRDSLGVTLPPDLLERWNLELGSRVIIELDEEHGGILLRPAKPEEEIDPEFEAMVKEIIERYRPALEGLAKR